MKAQAAGVGVARAAYLPQISANWQGVRENSVVNVENHPSLSEDINANVRTAGVNLNWMLYDFGGREAGLRNAKNAQNSANLLDIAQRSTVNANNSHVETGTFVMDEPLLYGARAKEANQQDYLITGTPPLSEVYGCMVRKDDPAFKKLADGVIARVQTSGEAERLYTKWFTQPVPPKGMNLNYPLSNENRELFKHPNDRALD